MCHSALHFKQKGSISKNYLSALAGLYSILCNVGWVVLIANSSFHLYLQSDSICALSLEFGYAKNIFLKFCCVRHRKFVSYVYILNI